MGKMKWRYLKKYYDRISLRKELVHVFKHICRRLGLTQQECFLMLLLLFVDVGRWLSPDDVKKVASDAYKMLISISGTSTCSTAPGSGVSLPLDLERGKILEVIDEELEEELRGIESEAFREEREEATVGESSSKSVEEEFAVQRISISNDVVRDWLEKLNFILSRLLQEFYILYEENEKLKKKNKELKASLDKIMDYILSYDPELYTRITKFIDKKLYAPQGYVKNRKVSL